MLNAIFESFGKIPRFSRDIIITEKIDGTNAQILVSDDGTDLIAGSRSKWISPGNDNFGFAGWVEANKTELLKLGPGRHFGEWWGSGIQRGYGLPKGERRFSLFNTTRWMVDRPACCYIVPVLYSGPFTIEAIENSLELLRTKGSQAVPFLNPEGIVIFHTAGNYLFKKTLSQDDGYKSTGVGN